MRRAGPYSFGPCDHALAAAEVTAYVVMSYIDMAYLVMAYVGMAFIVMAYVVMAHLVMSYVVMAYIVPRHWPLGRCRLQSSYFIGMNVKHLSHD